MKKISLQKLSSVLSDKELKNVLGGSGSSGNCKADGYTCTGDCHFTFQGELKFGKCDWEQFEIGGKQTAFCACVQETN
jgi:natural product precursor